MHKRISVGVATLLAMMFAFSVGTYTKPAEASRNSSGTMALYTPGNPVVSGTAISSSWANNTLTDLSTEITDSLSRSGKGGMLAALSLYAGTVATPGLNFSLDTGSGLYRIGSNNIGFAINGSKRQDWTTTGTTVTGTLSVTGVTTLTGAATLTGGVTGSLTVDQAGANTASSLTSGLKFGGTSSTEGIASNRSGIGANTNGLDLITGGTTRLQVASGGGVTATGTLTATGALAANGGLTIGSGTAISASYYGATTWSSATCLANTHCTVANITVTGAAAGAPCMVGYTPASGIPNGLVGPTCAVTANSCAVIWDNVTAGNLTIPNLTTVNCRVFNP